MLVVLKRKTIIKIVSVALAIITVFSLSVGVSSSVSATAKLGKTVVIDAGHGGIDGGVVGSITGEKESEINLAIAKSLKNYLDRNGYSVVLTRKNSEGLYSNSAKNKKRSDMEKRKNIIENAKPDMVVSIHQNYYTLSSVEGAQVFYGESETSSEYASVFQSHLNSQLGSDRVAKEGDYYLLNCTPYPSVIVECGFLSNAREEKLLTTPTYQKKVAYAIFVAIHSILGENEHAHH